MSMSHASPADAPNIAADTGRSLDTATVGGPAGSADTPPRSVAPGSEGSAPAAAGSDAVTDTAPAPAPAPAAIVLLPDGKAQCVCGSVINRSSIYRHAIAGDGHCSGGRKLTVEQLLQMKEITFAAKASYMRRYREKLPVRRARPARHDHLGLAHAGPSALDVHPHVIGFAPAGNVATPEAAAAAEVAAAEAAAAAAAAAAGTSPRRARLHSYRPMDGEERATCPAEGCGRSVRSRNLFEHVSSKSCRGGHLLSSAQLSTIKTIAKSARSKYALARKTLESDAAAASVNESVALSAATAQGSGLFLHHSVDPFGTAGLSADHADHVAAGPEQTGGAGANAGTGHSAEMAAAAAAAAAATGVPVPQGMSSATGQNGLISGTSGSELPGAIPASIGAPTGSVGAMTEPMMLGHCGSNVGAGSQAGVSPVSGTAALHEAKVPDFNDSLLAMSIREIGSLMARIVCRGHSDPDKKVLEEEIIAGVEAYRLTALVLCGKRPPAEVRASRLTVRYQLAAAVLAKSVLAKRSGDSGEDGVFWAVVEFIDRARSGELGRLVGAL